MLDKVPSISYNFFKEVVDVDSTDKQKLVLLKNLLQTMGWGVVNIVIRKEGGILIEIKNPPYGLQLEGDNWHFLVNTVLGYIQVIDADFEIVDVGDNSKNIRVVYGR